MGAAGDTIIKRDGADSRGVCNVCSESAELPSAALKEKRCYATTGARILLDINASMRENVLDVRLDIAGSDYLDCASVLKNGEETFFTYLDETTDTLHWKDENFGAGDNCFIRIVQVDGEMAWINPVPFASQR